ncbi:MAG: malto-oligosyltrehalose trehalohydrolase [Cyanobacteria bacterium P01_A01_bin.84]
MHIGSEYKIGNICKFSLWAPLAKEVKVRLVSPQEKVVALELTDKGYWQGTVKDVQPGSYYYYQVDDNDRQSDPASNSQPEGVHQASEIIDHNAFSWNDSQWKGLPLEQMVIYELHVGTFTGEGTFEAIIEKIPLLQELGVNTIEIMPVAQFPGSRNWGYDGVFPYAVQNSYGGVSGLKTLVNACHQQGMSVVLDVVYNHLGPEGNYLWGLGTYFTDKYKTPWGSAVNFDDAYSDGVRNYFVQNVVYWLDKYHIDGLRLDAIHAIYDFGAKHILQEMAEAVSELSQQQGREYYLIAESDLNDPRIICSPEVGGYGIDAQWSDDFHHTLHTALTREKHGYYEDFNSLELLAKVYRHGYAYTWDYSPFRKRYHGNLPSKCNGNQFVVCAQNHDQVGNRMLGDRLSTLIDFEGLKLAAAAVLLSPYVPMLFMGEEYGETNPFLYFISHGDPGLVEAVRKGRKEEFAAFHAQGEAPDPQAESTFNQSRLNWELLKEEKHQTLWQFYQKLLQMRQEILALKCLDNKKVEVSVINSEVIQLQRWDENSKVLCWLNFAQEPVTIIEYIPTEKWQKVLDSTDSQWLGEGSKLPEKLVEKQENILLSGHSVVVYSCI